MNRVEERMLPDGWKWVKLVEVISEAQPGFACGERSASGVIQLRMNNVDTRGNITWNDFLRVPCNANQLDKYQLIADDVLFNNTNSVELVGKSALFTNHTEPVVYSNHFTRLRGDKSKIIAAYLTACLIYHWNSKTFERICNRWIGQSAVKNEKLFALQIPLPPLHEQKRIAAILHDQMEAVEKARTAAEARLEAAKALSVAYLRDVFPQQGQDLPEGWKWVKLEDISNIISKGTTPTSLGFSFTSEGVPFLRAEDVVGGQINPTTTKFYISTETNEALSRSKLYPGDFLITIAGTLGRVGYIPLNAPIMNCNQAVAFVRLKSEYAYPEFLCYVCSAPDTMAPLLKQKAGGAIQNLNLQHISALQIPLPPLPEQKRIAFILNEQMTEAEKLRKAIEDQLKEINTLPAALLRKAFNGEF